MGKLIEVTDISTIAAGKKVTINLDTGWKYLTAHLKRTNHTAAQMLDVALKINGKIVQKWDTGTQIEAINTYYNRPQIAGFTTIFFNRPELADSEDRDLMGIGTADVRSVQLEYTIDGAAVNPDLEVHSEVTTNENLGWINHIEVSDIDLSKVGNNVISKMPIGNGNVFCYHINKPTDDITDAILNRVVNGQKSNLIDSSKEFLQVQQQQAAMRSRVPVANWLQLDFTVDGVPEGALQAESVQLPGVDGLSFVERVGAELNAATAETITVITESVGQFTG